MRRLTSEADVAEGAAALAAREPRFAHALALTGPLPLRWRGDGFAGLLHVLVSQQLSVASASAVWSRIEAAGVRCERTLAATDDDALRACGLSRPKIRYARALGEARIDFEALRAAPPEQAVERLTQVKGVGRWTAEVYLMFCVGHADIFAPGDLALQESARLLFALPARPKPDALEAMAEAWRPWRAVAARQLWAYYAVAKGREGVT
jgi:DNA-3-methyladenine glycosylase II